MEPTIICKVTKTDRRHTQHPLFAYYVTPAAPPPQKRGYAYVTAGIKLMDRALVFNQWRVWCWETWGPGTERDNPMPSAKWAWHTEQTHLRIYLHSEQELNWFKLRWI